MHLLINQCIIGAEMTKRISTQKTSKLSSTYNKVTTSVARFFSVAFKNFLSMFEGGSPQDILMERFQEWKEEEKESEALNYKVNFQVGQRVTVNNVDHIPLFRGIREGHVAKIVAITEDIQGDVVISLFNPSWISTSEDSGMHVYNVDPKKCQLEVVSG